MPAISLLATVLLPRAAASLRLGETVPHGAHGPIEGALGPCGDDEEAIAGAEAVLARTGIARYLRRDLPIPAFQDPRCPAAGERFCAYGAVVEEGRHSR